MEPHRTGIFDIRWNNIDSLIATCSGDRTTQISCAATYTNLNCLRGHDGTVKCASWDPKHSDLLSTGGRDGAICVYDLRAAERREELGALTPVLRVAGSHESTSTKTNSRKVPVSVTALAYNALNDHELISSGAGDG
jgi:denticleless